MRFKSFKTVVLTLAVFIGLGTGYVLASTVSASYNNQNDVWQVSGDSGGISYYLEHYPGYSQSYNQETRTYVQLGHSTSGDQDLAYKTASHSNILDPQPAETATNTPSSNQISDVITQSVGGTHYERMIHMKVPAGTYDVYTPYTWKKSNFTYDWEDLYDDYSKVYYWSEIGTIISEGFSPFDSIKGITLSDLY